MINFNSVSFFIVFIVCVSCQANDTAQPEGMEIIHFPEDDGIKTLFVDKTEVTNKQFQAFIDKTGYQTTAEKDFIIQIQKQGKLVDTLIQAGSLVFKPTDGPVSLHDYSQWWEFQIGANWRAPEGIGSSISDREDHPVVHISFEDAKAYAKWVEKRLPSEKEWEFLASGGTENTFSWGNEAAELATKKANFWQGFFPFENKMDDGFAGTAPVKTYEPNAFGLYEMSGNVWEWCVDDHGNPIVKGGSFLCNDSYCSGYVISSRMPNDQKSSLNHTGFRLVKDK